MGSLKQTIDSAAKRGDVAFLQSLLKVVQDENAKNALPCMNVPFVLAGLPWLARLSRPKDVSNFHAFITGQEGDGGFVAYNPRGWGCVLSPKLKPFKNTPRRGKK